MKLAVVSVVRNEMDVIRPFLSHLAALFDYAVLLDHRCTDGTGALLEAACHGRAGWRCWRVESPGHHQRLFAGFATKHVFETTDATIVFYLDADEFLDVPDRAALEAAIAIPEGARTAFSFAWRDAVPAQLDQPRLQLGDAIWVRDGADPFVKVAIPRALYRATAGAAGPSSGAHTVEPGDGGPVHYQHVGHILHLPLRSPTQMRRKILAGVLSVLAMQDRQAHESTHWFQALSRIADGGGDVSDLLHLASPYGYAPTDWDNLSAADLPRLGFTRRALDVAAQELVLPEAPGTPDDWQIMAAVLRDWQSEDGRDMSFVLDHDTLRCTHRPAPPDAGLGEGGDVEPRIMALETQLAEARQTATQAREALRILRASTSWRLTAPLRAVMGKMKQGARSV